MQNFSNQLEAVLASRLPEPGATHPRLLAAMAHSLLGGGKRLRPRLVAAAAALGDCSDETVLVAGAAVEMLHTYSLIHDDLPAMDADDLRRGKPTCHKVYGEAMAILAGDALQAQAFVLLAEAMLEAKLSGESACACLAEFASAAGPLHLVGGQAGDLDPVSDGDPAERVLWIHERKTAALIRCSLTLGGRLAGLPADDLAALAEIGRLLGLGFQTVDDLLDRSAARSELGKTPGKDRDQGKLTMPAALGEAEASAWADRYLEQALALIPDRPEAATLRAVADLLVNRRT